MKIAVTTHDGLFTFNGTGWHIDDEDMLHIRKTSGNAASFARGCWSSVADVADLA